jgi:hypothetical protein
VDVFFSFLLLHGPPCPSQSLHKSKRRHPCRASLCRHTCNGPVWGLDLCGSEPSSLAPSITKSQTCQYETSRVSTMRTMVGGGDFRVHAPEDQTQHLVGRRGRGAARRLQACAGFFPRLWQFIITLHTHRHKPPSVSRAQTRTCQRRCSLSRSWRATTCPAS